MIGILEYVSVEKMASVAGLKIKWYHKRYYVYQSVYWDSIKIISIRKMLSLTSGHHLNLNSCSAHSDWTLCRGNNTLIWDSHVQIHPLSTLNIMPCEMDTSLVWGKITHHRNWNLVKLYYLWVWKTPAQHSYTNRQSHLRHHTFYLTTTKVTLHQLHLYMYRIKILDVYGE